MEILALIPARGGSKGLPRKNVLPLLDHPLIAYSILAGRITDRINRVIVSTDNEEIAEVSLKYGAEIPFMRPQEYAQDLSTDFEVFYYTIKRLKEEENYVPDLIVQLRPTSPLRFKDDINNCLDLIINNPEADSLRTVALSEMNPYKMWSIEEGNPFLKQLLTLENIPEPFNEPRQNLPRTYWQTGNLDIMKASTILEKKSMTGRKIIPYVMKSELSVDIDTPEDFKSAEKLMMNLDCIKYDR